MENIHRNGQSADRRRRKGTMSNTYRDYMNRLRLALADFDPEFSSEILEDFEAHFTRSMENGKSEAEICRELGSIEDVIQELNEEFHATSPDVPKVTSSFASDNTSQQLFPVEKLCIQLLNASVQITSGEPENVRCDYDRNDFDERFVMYTEGNIFYLKEKPRSLFRFFGSGRSGGCFSLTLPPTVQKLEIASTNGQIRLASLKAETFALRTTNGTLLLNHVHGTLCDIHCVNGRLRLSDCCFNTLAASSTNGSIEADGSCDSVTLSSTNGSLMFHGKAEKTLQCKTVNGKIQIHYAKPEHGASLSLSTTWGGIRADFNQSQISGRKNLRTSYGSGALSVNAHTVNGGIRLQEI